MTDFFDSHEGNARNHMRWPRLARLLDGVHDLQLAASPRRKSILRDDLTRPSERVLVVGVSVPSRPRDMEGVTANLAHSRHQVTVSTVPMQPKGKFENIDDAIRAAPGALSDYDWLVVTDDDVDVEAGYLDRYLALARAADLAISQPAHKFHSHTTYRITRRRLGALVRQTRFVEIGPLTVLRSDTFDQLVPFPPSRWAYGLDVLWAELAVRNGWKMGIVDGMPVSHLRPVAGTYDMSEARNEGDRLLKRYKVQMNRADLFGLDRRLL